MKLPPIPDRMKHLPVFKGFPVPYVVLKDEHGTYHFKINEEKKIVECAVMKRCSICGQPLKGEYWFIGGQLSAYHPRGVFNDPPVHKDCGLFALKVCPYIVNKNYKAITTDEAIQKISEKIPDQVHLYNPTMLEERLQFFVFAKTKTYQLIPNGVTIYYATSKPYLQVEYYLEGERIHRARALELLKVAGEKSYIP